ncbi:TIGR03862 family flavoprotein [Rhodoferax saidenbachensis]|uniref:Flavoprotein (TIGR03862 family) n=1 Tax=Rhodoferax saidenbachensis TaxID=1484693 RepID=A0ABU1ZMT6_9BURK|nr:TIGR03862 family flavoprotein [Rhodoferax saidenbachensis]MDR7306678.1 putative flavoprotein (TIGR03862 family) [Rhodoferax saidenbachensis]
MTVSDSSPVTLSPLPLLEVEVAVIGGGPAGLMAAQVLADAGVAVHLFDAMPSVGRKFLLAGKGGLNLTHSDEPERFASRYGARREVIAPLLQGLDADGLRAWALGLGIETFVGTSGRVFPKDMKAAPLLRAWLQRLRNPTQADAVGVQFHMRHRWVGWDAQTLLLDTPQGRQPVRAKATVLALGGGSWARLGSDGAWVPLLAQQGVTVAPLLPANCGFEVQGGWSEFFRTKFAGQPFKSVAIAFSNTEGVTFQRKGEFVATATGVEGSLVYAVSGLLRDEILRTRSATFHLDLLPAMPLEKVLTEVSHPRGSRSLSSHLKSRLHLDGIKSAILHELLPKEAVNDPARLAAAIKALPITLQATRPLDEAISTAGGVLFEVLTSELMLSQLPGVFCAGEMLDWEAPTGGYLLQACFASGAKAGQGVLAYLRG